MEGTGLTSIWIAKQPLFGHCIANVLTRFTKWVLITILKMLSTMCVPFSIDMRVVCSRLLQKKEKPHFCGLLFCWNMNYLLSFSYFTVASIALKSAPGRNWILLFLIWEDVNLSALATPSLEILIWKLPKSPNLTIFPSARYFTNAFVRSLSTARTSVSDTVEPAPAISLARALKLTSPSALAEA